MLETVTGVVRKSFSGDMARAQSYIGQALSLLGAVKNQMDLGGLKQAVRAFVLSDGTKILVKSIFGQDAIEIDSPFQLSELESTSKARISTAKRYVVTSMTNSNSYVEKPFYRPPFHLPSGPILPGPEIIDESIAYFYFYQVSASWTLPEPGSSSGIMPGLDPTTGEQGYFSTSYLRSDTAAAEAFANDSHFSASVTDGYYGSYSFSQVRVITNTVVTPIYGYKSNVFASTSVDPQYYGDVYMANALGLYESWLRSRITLRQLRFKIDSDIAIQKLRSGVLPPEWDYWIKRRAPVSYKTHRASKMTVTTSDEILSVDSSRPGYLRETVRRTATYSYVARNGARFSESLVGTYSFDENGGAPTHIYENWYMGQSTSIFIPGMPALPVSVRTAESASASGIYHALDPDISWFPQQFLTDRPLNYDGLHPDGFGGSAGSGHPNDGDSKFDLGLLWSGELSGHDGQWDRVVTGADYHYEWISPTRVNTVRGLAPQILLDYRTAVQPTYDVEIGIAEPVYNEPFGDHAWCDSAISDRSLVHVIPFGLVTNGRSLGIYVDPADRRKNTASGNLLFGDVPTSTTHPYSFELGDAPTQIEVYGIATFSYNYQSGDLVFRRWAPAVAGDPNGTKKIDLGAIPVPAGNCMIQYTPLKWLDVIASSAEANSDQLVTLINKAIST